jgi:hypothetical protein
MAAGFGSGAMFSLLFGMGGPVSIGIQFAIAQAGNFTVSMNKMHLFDSFANQNYLVVPPWSPRAVERTLCQIYVD